MFALQITPDSPIRCHSALPAWWQTKRGYNSSKIEPLITAGRCRAIVCFYTYTITITQISLFNPFCGTPSMDFNDQLQQLSSKIVKMRDLIQTEEATKMAFVAPFINILGYDIFNPTEVVPEFICDVGMKKGEKVDYAIMKDGEPIILMECKPIGASLTVESAHQLFRYFVVTKARIGIITDGIHYRLFTDLDEPNKMDDKPFLEFNILEDQELYAAELKKLSKPLFNLDDIINSAGELKYTREIKKILLKELQSPSEDIVKLIAGQVYKGSRTGKVIQQFTDIFKRAFQQFINDRINERLKSAMIATSVIPSIESTASKPQPATNGEPEKPEENKDIMTTAQELEGFYIVKSILRSVVSSERIAMRDTMSYCGILLDDNNRKPICRLHFNREKKYLGLFNAERTETRFTIEHLDDIYNYSDQLRATVTSYEKPSAQEEAADTDAVS